MKFIGSSLRKVIHGYTVVPFPNITPLWKVWLLQLGFLFIWISLVWFGWLVFGLGFALVLEVPGGGQGHTRIANAK